MRTMKATISGWCLLLVVACSGEHGSTQKPSDMSAAGAAGEQPQKPEPQNPDEPIPSTCAGFVRRLTECGVLTGTRFARCKDDSPALACLVSCATGASCDDIINAYCAADPNEYADCALKCRELPMGFTCNDGTIIRATWKCDGTPDCPDGEDEDCADGTFVCQGGQHIPAGWHCDGNNDCPGAEDEADCPDSPMFVCDDGVVRPESDECDGVPDCAGGEDEADCTKLVCN